MKIEVNNEGVIEVSEFYSGLSLRASHSEQIGICIRDGAFEFVYDGWLYRAKDGVVGTVQPFYLHEEISTTCNAPPVNDTGVVYMLTAYYMGDVELDGHLVGIFNASIDAFEAAIQFAGEAQEPYGYVCWKRELNKLQRNNDNMADAIWNMNMEYDRGEYDLGYKIAKKR